MNVVEIQFADAVRTHQTSDEATVHTDDGTISMFQTNRRAIILSVTHDLFDDEGELRRGIREDWVKQEMFDQIRQAMVGEAGSFGG